MSGEIKIKYGEVDEALSNLISSTNTLKPSSPQGIQGSNVLDSVEKLETLNQSLNKLLESYKLLIMNNAESTKQSVQAMKDTDQELSSSMKIR
jgi:superfamily I DNA and/or RNA helicase